MRFLFWNIKKNSIGRILWGIVDEYKAEVVILAECPDEGAILSDLNAETDKLFHLTDSKRTRVVIYTRFPREYIQSEHHDNFLTIRRLCLPGRREILIGAIHFQSKLFRDEDHQWAMISRISRKIRDVENRVGHSRTILVGDLNMNPFEKGMISANGLHAVMTRDIAGKRSRIVDGESYPFFYNPMWGRFGDTTEGPPGTYYRRSSAVIEYFWHTYDQVLIRPDMLDSFDSLRVLTECRGISFVKKSGVPNDSRISDHLPLLFALRV